MTASASRRPFQVGNTTYLSGVGNISSDLVSLLDKIEAMQMKLAPYLDVDRPKPEHKALEMRLMLAFDAVQRLMMDNPTGVPGGGRTIGPQSRGGSRGAFVAKTARTLPDIQQLTSFQTGILRTFLEDYRRSGQPMDLPILRDRLARILPEDIRNALTPEDFTRIIRTETAYTSRQQNIDATKEAHGNEVVNEKKWHWLTSKDQRVCKICNTIENGGSVKIVGKMIQLSGNPYKLRELESIQEMHNLTIHPQCRCAVRYNPLESKSLMLEKSNNYISGFAHVETLDLLGDLVLNEGMKESVKWFLKHTPIIHVEHESFPIGRIVKMAWKMDPRTKKQGLWLRCQLFKGYKPHQMVLDDLKAGKFKGFSIKFFPNRYVKQCKDDVCQRVIRDISLVEISLVSDPANPAALLDSLEQFEKCLSQ